MRRLRGFVYAEVIAATALIGIALLIAVSLTAAAPRAARQVRASRAALEAVENTIEQIRSGSVPLPANAGVVSRANGVEIRVDVKPTDVRDLLRVTVESRVRIEGRLLNRRVDTLVWRPQ